MGRETSKLIRSVLHSIPSHFHSWNLTRNRFLESDTELKQRLHQLRHKELGERGELIAEVVKAESCKLSSSIGNQHDTEDEANRDIKAVVDTDIILEHNRFNVHSSTNSVHSASRQLLEAITNHLSDLIVVEGEGDGINVGDP